MSIGSLYNHLANERRKYTKSRARLILGRQKGESVFFTGSLMADFRTSELIYSIRSHSLGKDYSEISSLSILTMRGITMRNICLGPDY